jgi:hypothetical protein
MQCDAREVPNASACQKGERGGGSKVICYPLVEPCKFFVPSCSVWRSIGKRGIGAGGGGLILTQMGIAVASAVLVPRHKEWTDGEGTGVSAPVPMQAIVCL